MTTVSGTKIWNNNGSGNYWPENATVTVGLYTRVDGKDMPVMDGKTAKTDTVNTQGETYSFSDLPKYDTDGQKITYVVKEQSVKISNSDGETTYTVDNEGKITIGNNVLVIDKPSSP